jgi:HD superfamily phosphohydrolase
MSQISFEEYVNDPLHGPIGITLKELEVIRTRAFQRLKNIKQLGTANFVYPGANHSRFEHSIGTMHLTSLVLNRLRDWDTSKEQTIRLAALLHDIGHGPFSHTFEELLTRNEQFVSVFDGEKLRDHEDFSRYVLKHNNELKSILGPDTHRIVNFLFMDEPLGGIPGEIITGDMGTDRLDYLLRDTYYAGLGHRPDIQSLISNLRILARNKAHPRLAVEDKGILSAEFLITTRYYHYSMIVHNPRTRAVELLFIKLLEGFLKRQKDAKKYLFEAFTQHDDNIVLGDLFHFSRDQQFAGRFPRLFYSGRSFIPVYSINLRQIRSGVTKYCIYRFFFDGKGLIEYINEVNIKLKETISSGSLIFDVHLFKHDVPDMIFFSQEYETKKEWVTPFLIDRSNILRLVPSEQLLQSQVCVMSEKDIDDKKAREFYDSIEAERGLFLDSEALVPIARKSMSENGFQLIDDLYTFLSALRDFYGEKPWKETTKDSQKIEVFRGITRFYDLVYECHKRTDRIALPFKSFFKGETLSFPYSTKGFSILNALATMNILRLEYIPVEGQSGKPFHFAYLIKPVERAIRKTVYEGITEFDKLRVQFYDILRKLDWDKYFAEFFPLKDD